MIRVIVHLIVFIISAAKVIKLIRKMASFFQKNEENYILRSYKNYNYFIIVDLGVMFIYRYIQLQII